MTWRGAALRGTAVVVVLAVGAVLYLGRDVPHDPSPHPLNHDRNAVWLEHRWLEKAHPPEEVEALFAALQRRGIGYVFPHLIPFGADGQLPPHSRDQMRAFLAAARRIAPEVKVLPWIGGLRAGYKRMRPGTIRLDDLVQRQRIVAECRGLVDEGFDGVHVNIEPVNEGNVDFLALLRALRNAVGEDRVLSVSAIRPGPIALPMAPNFLWTPGYYTRVAGVTDQIVIMSYDTALPTPALYRRYVAWAATTVTTALTEGHLRARVLMGIPTYDETGLMHRASVETPENALRGVVAGLRGRGGGGTFEGIALYAEWTTDEAEWESYERIWRGRAPARD
jgi:hypothetical protein